MRKLRISGLVAAATVLLTSGLVFAQDGGDVPQLNPVEMWVCNFNERKDQGDMDDVYDALRELEAGQPYAAWQLNPYYVNPNQEFDFLYIGAWPSGTAMGQDLTNYLSDTDVSDAWNETVTCPASIIYAGMQIQPLPDGGDGEFLLSISDCTVAHGHSNAQAMGALARFNQYAVANGSEVPTFAWFPVYGAGSAEFTFKLVQAFDNPQHLGDTFQWFVDTAAYRVQEDMTDGTVSCDSPRLYLGSTIIEMPDGS